MAAYLSFGLNSEGLATKQLRFAAIALGTLDGITVMFRTA